MKLHTVFISCNRIALTRKAIESYLETVSVPFTFTIVDNASTDGTQEWILKLPYRALITRHLLTENRYPGFACNLGWSDAPADATFLHRADNDFNFIPGWCEEARERFQDPKLGQLGLRTDAEEEYVTINTGGNCIIRRELFDQGLRYDERPWSQYPAGWTEDSFFSPAVEKMGYEWARVQKPCIISTARVDLDDDYYRKSLEDRGIFEWAKKRMGIT